MVEENTRKIDLGRDFGAVAITVNGRRIEVSADGDIHIRPAHTNTVTAIAAAKKALEIGQRMKDGTVVIAVDLKENFALFAPKEIFGGGSNFNNQDDIVKKANEEGLHGHSDWRRVTDKEASALAHAWDKVAPPALQGSAAPWFWGASGTGRYDTAGHIYRGGEADWGGDDRGWSHPVPVVRSGPARG